MNFIADQRTKALIHELVPRQRSLALEFAGDHQCLEMSIVCAAYLDGRVVKSGLNQAAYLDWIHADQMIR